MNRQTSTRRKLPLNRTWKGGCALIAAGKQRAEVWGEVVKDPVYTQRLHISVAKLCKSSQAGSDRSYTGEDVQSEATRILLQRNHAEGPFPWKPEQPFGHWLAKVVARACKEALRGLTRHPQTIPFSELEGEGSTFAEPENEERQRLVWLREAIAGLDEPYRTVMWLFIVEGWSQKEIAERLEYSRAWVSGIVQEGMLQLRQQLGLD